MLKADHELGGGSTRINIGGGLAKCIIHFTDIKSDKITLLSGCDDPELRLQKLHDVSKRRLEQPHGSVHRMSDVCSQIPSMYSEGDAYGYHRECYQRFTGNLNRFLSDVDTED